LFRSFSGEPNIAMSANCGSDFLELAGSYAEELSLLLRHLKEIEEGRSSLLAVRVSLATETFALLEVARAAEVVCATDK